MSTSNDWSQQLLQRLGAQAPGESAQRLRELGARLDAAVAAGHLSALQASEALAQIGESARPAQTLRYVLQLCEDPAGRAALNRSGRALSVFIALAAQGPHPAHLLLRYPEDLEFLACAHQESHLQPGGRGVDALVDEVLARIEKILGNEALVDEARREEVVFAELRGLKRRESLRIYLREIDHASAMRQTAAEIAQLAEACLQVACLQGAQVLGAPELVEHFCILGMGKLGGGELNFSSDVDLIYICSDWAKGAEDALARDFPGRIDHLARWVTRAMSQINDDGYVFRVDLRLRPEGSRGALVNSVGAAVDYYLNWGRTWERSALVKARPVAGNRALGESLLARLEPFIYRRYLDFTVLDDLRAMKEQIDQHAQLSAVVGMSEAEVLAPEEPRAPEAASSLKARLRQKLGGAPTRPRAPVRTVPGVVQTPANRPAPGSPAPGEAAQNPESPAAKSVPGGRASRAETPYGWDVKIGVGGIREIEFFVQALQLIHSGTRAALRVRSTLEALDRLLYAGLITHEDHTLLSDAYDLFRRVEHRVQMEHDRQSHRLPQDAPGFAELARRMHMVPEGLRERLTHFRRGVAAIFERLFEESAQKSDEPTVREQRPSELMTVLGVGAEHLFDQAVLGALVALGFRHPRQVAGQLQVLRQRDYGPLGARAGTEQSQLGRYILQACASAPDPDQAFSHWTRLSTILGARPGFYHMLFENPHATRLLIHLLGSSEFLASIVLREPNVIDYLLGAQTMVIVREREEMARELGRRLQGIDDPSHRLGRMRRFQQEEVLRIALHEVAGACDIQDSVRQLSMLAETLIEAVLTEVYENLIAQRKPTETPWPRLDELGFVVLAMGKLGGREITFGSDLDVVFIYEPQTFAGFEPSFFVRLAQRLMRNLAAVGAQGKMYDVDTRLRPSGTQGTLVVSLDAFCDYHQNRADLWERQAMLRARPLTGARALRQRLMELRAQLVFGAAPAPDLAAQMRAMRARISQQLGSDGVTFDIKHDSGGMVDVEFMTQYLQLCHGGTLASDDSDERVEQDDSAKPAEDLTASDAWSGRRVVDGARSQNTLRALRGLAAASEAGRVDLGGVDCLQLMDDYRMLRRVEARLRMHDLRAQNQLPTDAADLDILARRLGYQGQNPGAQFKADLNALRTRVTRAWRRIMGG